MNLLLLVRNSITELSMVYLHYYYAFTKESALKSIIFKLLVYEPVSNGFKSQNDNFFFLLYTNRVHKILCLYVIATIFTWPHY